MSSSPKSGSDDAHHRQLEQLVAGKQVHRNLPAGALVEHAIRRSEGRLAANGALASETGKRTGRSPKDKFTVKDSLTADPVDWGAVNQPLEPAIKFSRLR